MKVSFIFAILALCLALPLALFAQEANPIQLPSPQTSGGMPLMQALKERKSTRAFSQREIPLQVLSDLLWAADGINRSDSVGRTAPSAHNAQEIDIYLIKADGVYLYVPKANTLIPVLAQDVRGLAGKQDFVKTAPLNLIFVADLSKLKGKDADFYAAADTGFISENVYLFCASAGLGTVVRGWVDKEQLSRAMKLRPTQKIILAQTVGYPKE
jgi:SagB-type dehydrogenase family enzyme